MKRIICPICRKDDAIVKVSSVYESGVTYSQHEMPVTQYRTQVGGIFNPDTGGVQPFAFTSSEYAGTRTVTRTNRTALSERLAPPEFSGWPEDYSMFSTIFGKLSIPCGAITATGLLVLGLSLPSPPAFIVYVVLFGVPLTLFLLFRANRKARDIREANHAANQALYRQYRSSMDRWNRSYYCQRDGMVFDPETGSRFF